MLKPVKREDMEHALDHSSDMVSRDSPLSLDDFVIGKPKLISLEKLDSYDDIDSWLELDREDFEDLDEEEFEQELTPFRGNQWAARAVLWKKPEDIPPIVIVRTYDGFSGISDGRGRVNYAFARGFKNIPAVILVEKPKISKSLKKIALAIKNIFK